MSKEEIIDFLNQGAMTAKVSTASASGVPHVAPVWFMIDNNNNNRSSRPKNRDDRDLVLVFTTSEKSVKAKQLLGNPKVSVCIDDQKPPFSFVIINGIAEIEHNPDHDVLLKYTTKLAEKYMGKENSERFGRRNAVEGELVVRIKPTKIIAQKNVSD
ncbi:MAG: PPOX class F420-dependent oxidoreductase [Candidatus Nitrosocosmicus sp.]